MNDKEIAEAIGQARDMLARFNAELDKLERRGWVVTVDIGTNNRPAISVTRVRTETHEL